MLQKKWGWLSWTVKIVCKQVTLRCIRLLLPFSCDGMITASTSHGAARVLANELSDFNSVSGWALLFIFEMALHPHPNAKGDKTESNLCDACIGWISKPVWPIWPLDRRDSSVNHRSQNTLTHFLFYLDWQRSAIKDLIVRKLLFSTLQRAGKTCQGLHHTEDLSRLNSPWPILLRFLKTDSNYLAAD